MTQARSVKLVVTVVALAGLLTMVSVVACSSSDNSTGSAPDDSGADPTADSSAPTDGGTPLGDAATDAPKDGPADAPTDTARVRPTANKLVFATRAMFPATFGSGGKDPQADADAKCNAAAIASGLGGTWKAWLSTTTTRAADHLDDVAGGWYNFEPPPQQFCASKLCFPGRGVGYDEYGIVFDPSDFFDPVWTGTNTSNAASVTTETCNDWTSTSSADEALVGDPRVTHIASWTAGGTLKCNGAAHLYCLEQ